MSKNIIGELKVNDKIIDGDSKLKQGYYIFNEEEQAFIYVGEDVPSDYWGISYYFGKDGLYIDYFIDGSVSYEAHLSGAGLSIYDVENDARVNLGTLGVDKLIFASLTFSLTQLDSTLRQLVEDAISSSGQGVACSEAQWNVIKEHLDNCLYFRYNNYSMIKTFVGVNDYTFGSIANYDNIQNGYYFNIQYYNSRLFAEYFEL